MKNLFFTAILLSLTITSCSEKKEHEGKDVYIVTDLVTYSKIAYEILHSAINDKEVTMSMIEDEIDNFEKVTEVISWATENIVNIMNPASASPN